MKNRRIPARNDYVEVPLEDVQKLVQAFDNRINNLIDVRNGDLAEILSRWSDCLNSE